MLQRKKLIMCSLLMLMAYHIADVKEVLQHHPEATVIGQPEICGYFNHPNSIDINYGGSAKFDDLKISMVPGHHNIKFSRWNLWRSNLAVRCSDSKVKTCILQEIQA